MEDVLDAYFSLRDRADLSGQVYNIGSGKQHTVGEITDTILRLTGNRAGCSPGMPRAWKDEPAFWEADISHARTGLGWQPHYSLAEGLALTIDWFGRNLFLYPEGREP
jgi:nucleoside-diphosphate-sugar epimerase